MNWLFNCKRLYPLIIICLGVLAPNFTFAATDAAESAFIPWSGYWWPTNGGGLATGNDYHGHPAPLEKYDFLTTGSYAGPATQFYLQHNFDPNAPMWYGFCGAWASAAVTENIDFYPSVIDKVLWNVGDKKGLLTACHEYDVATRVDAHDPSVFHAWLLQYIKEAGISFYAELDPSDQVWNYPVYRYEMTTLDNGDQLNVTCQIWYADDQVDPDLQGTVSYSKIYTYTLDKGANGDITGGEWTGSSVIDHPQQLVLPITPYSTNPYLDYNLIRNLAATRDDQLESDQTVAINPGGYTLLLLNEDDYSLDCDTGDTILLHVAEGAGYPSIISVDIRDAGGNAVYSGEVGEGKDIQIEAAAPPYTITFSADDYSANALYYLDYDLKKSFEFANTKIQKGFSWGGFAITNAGDEICNKVYVVGYDAAGRPLDTYAGPFALAPGEKKTVLVSDFAVKKVDGDKFAGVKVLASLPLQVVNLFGYFGKNMSMYVPVDDRQRFVIPDISAPWDYSRSVQWGLYNPGLEDIQADLRLFTAQGVNAASAVVALPANSAVAYTANDSPFADDESNGWVLVEAENGKTMSGHAEWLENGIARAEAMSMLPVGREFFVPQVVADSAFWTMKVTLINVSSEANSVTLTTLDGVAGDSAVIQFNPYEKKTMDIGSLFAGTSSELLNRSSLRVEAAQDIAGLVRFETTADFLSYPLIAEEDNRQELVVPHVAENAYWWTGVSLFNSSPEQVNVQIVPYNVAGNVMEDMVFEHSLAGQSKFVFCLTDLFGQKAGEVSFVKFKVLNGPGIAGLLAYGNRACTMVSGAVLR